MLEIFLLSKTECRSGTGFCLTILAVTYILNNEVVGWADSSAGKSAGLTSQRS